MDAGQERVLSLETLLPRLEDSEQPVPTTELGSLSALNAADRKRFLDVWRGLSIRRRRDLIDRLADLAEDNVDFDFDNLFLAGLLDPDVQVRADSVRALWEYEDDDLAAMLLRLLDDPEALVRGEAALGLGRFLLRAELEGRDDARTREIEERLRAIINDEQEIPEVRGRAIEAIGARSHDWVTDVIDDAYASGDRRLRISAVHAMGRNADPQWLPTLLEEMESEDGELRFEAATAAGSIGDEEAIPSLARLAEDDDAEVQEAAIAALGQIGGPSARSALQGLVEDQRDERVLNAVNEALAEAEFTEDPLGVHVQLDAGAADDDDEGEDDE